jgi:hypothetical protein
LPETISSIKWTFPNSLSLAKFRIGSLFFSRSWSLVEILRYPIVLGAEWVMIEGKEARLKENLKNRVIL